MAELSLSQMSDAELDALYKKEMAAQGSSGNSSPVQDLSKMSNAELDELYKREMALQAQAQASVQESPRNLPQPVSSNDKVNVQALIQSIPASKPTDGLGLSTPQMSPEFVRDFRALTGVHPETLPLDQGTNVERYAQSPKDAFNAAIANGLINPNFLNDAPDKFQNFETKWNEYKAEMESSMLGAAYRGAKSAALPTAAAIAAGAAASPSTVGAIGASMAAGMGTSALQEQYFPPTTEERAQRAFDESKWQTRNARLAGEILPQFASGTVRPTLNAQLFKLAPEAIKQTVATTALMAGLPAGMNYIQGNKFDAERFGWGVANAVFTTPTRFGQRLFDKFARTEMLATEARNKIFQDERFSGINATNRPEAINRLRQYGQASVDGIQPMMGEYLENQPIISLQKALQNSTEGARMRQRQYDNQVAAAAANERITGHQTTVDPQPARAYFEHEHARLNAAAEQTRQQLIAQGDTDAATIIQQAHAQSEALNQFREQGIASAEAAVKSANSIFTQAIEEIHAARGTSTSASTRAVHLLESLKQAAYVPVKAAYDSIPKSVRTDYEFTYKAAKAASSPKNLGKLKEVPVLIKRILDNYAPRINSKGKVVMPSEPVSVMMKDLEAITEGINTAVLAKENFTANLLKGIKDAIEKDLTAAGDTWQGVKTARDMYYEYAQKYVNGTLGEMLHASQSLDKDLRLSEILYSKSSGNSNFNGPQQLLMALNGSGEDMILQQLMNDMAQKGGNTSASLEKWINSDQISRILSTFPLRDHLEAVINTVRDAEVVANRARAELQAREGVPIERANRAELERAEQVRRQAREIAELQYRTERERLQGDVFTSFVGADPRNAIKSIMTSNDPVGVANQIMQLASADVSGEAVIGFQNAMRQHYKEAVRGSKALTSGVNIDDPLQLSQLQVVSGKINTALVEGGPIRSVMDVVLPPAEMQALDVLRRQVQYITNPFRSVSGESPTASLMGAKASIEEALNSNVVGILGKLARGGNLTNKNITTKNTRLTDMMEWLYYGQPSDVRPNNKALNAAKRFAEEWFGLTGKRMGERATELLVDGMLNPGTVGVEILENTPASPRVREYVRAYVLQKDQMIQQPTVLPFNSMNTSEVKLENGRLLKDGTTGYSIQNVGNKFKTFNQKGERIGIFNNLEDARQFAVSDYNKYIAKKKSGR
jgi:hypothetical protein